MHLMRLANSSGLGLGHKVTSLREAINATGTNRIARWTQLLLYADGRKVSLEDDPLLQLAATRARFRSFVNSDRPDEHVVFVEERGQIRPARPDERSQTPDTAIA